MNRSAFHAALGGLLCPLLLAPSAASAASVGSGSAPAARSVVASLHKPLVHKPLALRRWGRELVRRGDRDRSPKRIEHVRELQYRLRWAGEYHAPVTGRFNKRTELAVRSYQRRHHLDRTGVANHKTWRRLIPDTIRGRRAIPRSCRRPGWHACYDRHRHQVTLWHRGRIKNSWLARGGTRRHVTRTGRFTVFRRSRHHVSNLYGSPMPYAQFFSGGEAFHASYAMVDPFRGHSHGCVNMYIKDARQLWKLTADKNLHVRVYGRWS